MFKNAVTLVAVLASALPASATMWSLDTEHSTVGFSVRHMMVSDVKGAFDKYTGTVDLDDTDVTKSKVNIEVEVASINTKSAKRDEHLRGADFFDAVKFPKLTFKSTKIEKAGTGFKVTGDLTLHHITKSVVLDVAALSDEFKDPWGGTHRGTSATTRISRKDFGLTWTKAIDKGGVVVGDEVLIELQIELMPVPAKK